MNDMIVAEVRKMRDEHARKFNYDLSAICADIRAHQKDSRHRIVNLRKANESANKVASPDPEPQGGPVS